jgi:hypothetical protein
MPSVHELQTNRISPALLNAFLNLRDQEDVIIHWGHSHADYQDCVDNLRLMGFWVPDEPKGPELWLPPRYRRSNRRRWGRPPEDLTTFKREYQNEPFEAESYTVEGR